MTPYLGCDIIKNQKGVANLENQNIEWKSIWKDEFLKELCGFANSQGGICEVGRADSGKAVGVSNIGKLMDDLSNTSITSLKYIQRFMQKEMTIKISCELLWRNPHTQFIAMANATYESDAKTTSWKVKH